MNPEKNLMISVLATQIQGYINAREMTDFSFMEEIIKLEKEIKRLIKKSTRVEKQKYHNESEYIKWKIRLKQRNLEIAAKHRKKIIVSQGRSAEIYIFENNEESDNYVFGFNFICRHLELDPERFRKKIRELRLQHIRELSKGWEKKRI